MQLYYYEHDKICMRIYNLFDIYISYNKDRLLYPDLCIVKFYLLLLLLIFSCSKHTEVFMGLVDDLLSYIQRSFSSTYAVEKFHWPY